MDQKLVLKIQKGELTEHIIYKKLAGIVKNKEHGELLERISREELKHYNVFKSLTGKESSPDNFRIFLYVFIARFLGLNFGLKLMESGENLAQDIYKNLISISPEVELIICEEEKHEKEIIELIDEERLKYIGSVVLGLSDALVELTGALVGLTFALANARVVATAGAITGIAASLSMAASEFLSTKSEGGGKNPIKASVYTGIAYILTVTILILPYLLFSNLLISITVMLMNAVIIIFAFTFYISVAKGLNFRKRFLEMVSISLGVAALSFLIGLGVRAVLKIEL